MMHMIRNQIRQAVTISVVRELAEQLHDTLDLVADLHGRQSVGRSPVNFSAHLAMVSGCGKL
jgi:hypothetical protein